ncbi:MAG: Hsp20/alpha crystallin family protein [Chitinophagaceae bacterium]
MTHLKFNQRPFEKSFNNLMDDFFSELPVLYKNNGNQQWNGFVPVNIKDQEKNYVIEVVAPGFEKADFKINIDQDVLTISAEKKDEAKTDSDSNRNEKQIRKEYNYRSFKRSFTIDEKIDSSSIEAKYVNGVLTLNLPKKEQVKASAKEITIL